MSGALAVLSSTQGGGAVVAAPSFNGGAVTLGSDGSAGGTSYTGNTSWFNPITTGIGGAYWARTTKTSGPANFSPASGTWYSLAAGQTWGATGGVGAANGTIDIASDAGGASIVATGSISVNNTL